MRMHHIPKNDATLELFMPPDARFKRHSIPEFWALCSAYLIAALFFAATVFISTHRLFWRDEVATTFGTRQPDWTSMWRALTAAADATPVGYFAIARISDHLLGP